MLAERIRRLASGLESLGVGHGDRIAWIGPNHAAFLEALFAAGSLGAVLAPVNHRLAADDRALVLEDAEPTVLIEHEAVGPTRAPASVRDVWIVDRVDASFVAGGRTVYPGDIERQLMTHPAVADAGVVARATRGGDTAGAAFVVLEPGSSVTETELLAFARTRLAPHEVPMSITWLDRLPRSSVGKLLRAELRALTPDGSRRQDGLS